MEENYNFPSNLITGVDNGMTGRDSSVVNALEGGAGPRRCRPDRMDYLLETLCASSDPLIRSTRCASFTPSKSSTVGSHSTIG